MIKKFNGHKRLLLGNHDHFPIQTYIDAGFEKIYATWRGLDNGSFILSHIPIHPQSMGSAVANVHGHIHTAPSYKPVVLLDKNNQVVIKPYLNVSIEATGYHPITLEEVHSRIREEIDKWDEKST